MVGAVPLQKVGARESLPADLLSLGRAYQGGCCHTSQANRLPRVWVAMCLCKLSARRNQSKLVGDTCKCSGREYRPIMRQSGPSFGTRGRTETVSALIQRLRVGVTTGRLAGSGRAGYGKRGIAGVGCDRGGSDDRSESLAGSGEDRRRGRQERRPRGSGLGRRVGVDEVVNWTCHGATSPQAPKPPQKTCAAQIREMGGTLEIPGWMIYLLSSFSGRVAQSHDNGSP